MRKRPLGAFFVLTFAITWGLGALLFAFPDALTRIFGPMSTQNPVFILAVWAPTLSAFIVTGISEGKAGVLRLLRRFLPGSAGLSWHLLPILAVPACGILINLVTGSETGLFTVSSNALLTFLFINLITGPLGEEFGWRGFALPRLLRTHSPLVASLVLGIIWAFWHLPSFFVSGLPQGGVQLPLFFLGALALSIIMTWLYLRADGSIFFGFLLHYSVNFTLSMITTPFLYLTLLQSAVALLLCVVYGSDLRGPNLPREKASVR
jgi:membrane protease YdiL (CAAX protease family)